MKILHKICRIVNINDKILGCRHKRVKIYRKDDKHQNLEGNVKIQSESQLGPDLKKL
jgi:hypothetical protein